MLNSTKLALFVPMTIALAVSQSLHASSLSDGQSIGPVTKWDQGLFKGKGPASKRNAVKRNAQGVRELDMTNAAQYSMVKSRLDRAGRPAEHYPQLHETLNIKRMQQVANPQGTELTRTATAEEPDIIKNAHLFLDMNVAVSETNNKPYLLSTHLHYNNVTFFSNFRPSRITAQPIF